MIKKVRDWDLLIRATEQVREICPVSDLKIWFEDDRHFMLTDGENVGLATLEYPGVYSVHWYFQVRGRKALDLGRAMVEYLFNNSDAKAVRGLVKKELKASRWACRQIGLQSYGFITYADGDENELFCATKDDYLKGTKNG